MANVLSLSASNIVECVVSELFPSLATGEHEAISEEDQ